MTFKDIVFVESLNEALFAQAKYEGKLDFDSSYLLKLPRRNRRNIQKALSLLAIYDKVTVLEYFLPGEDSWRGPKIPFLEQEGILDTQYSLPEFARAITAHGANYYDNRDPRIFLEAIDNVIDFLPYVLDQLVCSEDRFVDGVTATGVISKRKFLEQILRYVRSFYAGDEQGMESNILHHMGFVEELQSDLRHQKPRDGLNAVDTILFKAFFEYERINSYQLLSSKTQAPLAGANLSKSIVRRLSLKESLEKAEKSTNAMAIMKLSMEREGLFFPYIDSIEQAIQLRKKPDFKVFRSKIHDLNNSLSSNKSGDIDKLCKEIIRANAFLEKSEKWGQRLKFITYFSLPASLLESTLWGVPVVGTTLSVTSVLGTRATDLWKKKGNWIMIGK